MTDYPGALDTYTDPASGDKLNNPSHSVQHQNHNDAVEAIEGKLGTGASTPIDNTFLIGNGAGASVWSALTSAQLRARLSDETGTGVAVFNDTPTITTPVLTTPTIASFASATHDHSNNAGGGTALNSPTITTPKIITALNDTNGNELIKVSATASAVNEITVTNAATGNAPSISATGGDSAAHLNLRGKGSAKTVTIGAGATTIFPYDYVVSGCVLSGDSYGSTLNYSMTSGVVVINGNPITVASFSATAATASRDTYVDVLDNGDGTGLVVNTGGNVVTNNNASPALAANSIRIGIVVSGAGSIAAAASINQGQEDKLLPIASSTPYTFTDSLGNIICPRDPHRKILGYRRITTAVSSATSGSDVDITGLSTPVIVPENRKVRITVFGRGIRSSMAAGNDLLLMIKESTTTFAVSFNHQAVSNYYQSAHVSCVITPSAGLHTYKAMFQQTAAGTIVLNAASTAPCFILVELV